MNSRIMMASRGYDMTPTMYSPDGRIYQVEYAIETVKRGTLAIGVKGKNGVIIAVEEKPRALQVSEITQKIFQVDEHIGVAAAGYIPDARVQVDDARYFSQSNKLTYDEPVEIETVAKHLADQSHQFTQYSGVRPFGVALIIAGGDRKGSTIYVTDPSGTYVSYSAMAIGSGSDEVNDFLEKKNKPEIPTFSQNNPLNPDLASIIFSLPTDKTLTNFYPPTRMVDGNIGT